MEGFNDTTLENSNFKAAFSYLSDRYQKDNLNGLSDDIILKMISRLASYGNDDLDKKVADILNSSDANDKKVDKLDEIFGIPLYDALNDSLVIYYDFKEIDHSDPKQHVIPNKTTNIHNSVIPSTYDAKIILGETNQTDSGSVLNSTNPIINGSHLQLFGGHDKPATSRNGAYLLLNNSPTFYKGNSFLGFSFSIWFNTNSSSGRWSRLIDLGNGKSANGSIFITNNYMSGYGSSTSTKKLGFFIMNENFQWKFTYLKYITIEDDAWAHLVWTISTKGEWKIYLNNEILCEKEIYVIPPKVNRQFFYIGNSNWDWDGLYNGKMADFRLYQRKISAEDVNKLYNMGKINPNISSTNLPVRKGVNLITNGSFSYPRIRIRNDVWEYENDFIIHYEEPKNWSATRKIVISNVANNGYSNHLGMVNQSELGYCSQLAILTNDDANNNGYLRQTDIRITPYTRYELSFLHCLWAHNPHKDPTNVYLSVKLGCYVTDKPIVPRVSNYDSQNLSGWQKYSKEFDTDENCMDETLTITFHTPPSGHNNCGIANVSLRKLNNISPSTKPVFYPGA
jgi:hypothetical protein